MDLYKLVYPQEPFDDQKLRSTISDLHKVIEEYLVHAILQTDDTEKNLLLLRWFRQRNRKKHFLKSYVKHLVTGLIL